MQSPCDRLKNNLVTAYKRRRLVRGILGALIAFALTSPLALVKWLAWIPLVAGMKGWSIFISDKFDILLTRLKQFFAVKVSK